MSKSSPATAVHTEQPGPRDLHEEMLVPDVTAAHLADDLLQVDEKRAEALRHDMAANVQAGWNPATAEEKALSTRLNWKLDLMILPIVSLGYMFNQLDRANLGNAQTSGFSADLGIPSSAVNTASSLFFATYVPFQPVAAAFGRRVGAPLFLGITLFTWGVLTISHAFVKNDAQLIAVRLLMGLAECGFYPTVLAYLSEFYPRYNCSLRYAVFYGASSVAGAFGGLIAFGMQYLFILEGCIPIVLGLLCPFWLATNVRSAWYLAAEQRAFAEKRMVVDSAANIETRRVTRRDFYEALTDWRVWAIMLSNTLASISSQGFTVFFPVVVKGLGYTQGTTANLMTVPPYIAGALGVWLFAWSSDRRKERTFHLLAGMSIVILGLILTIVIPLDNVGGRYAGLMVLMFGTFIHSPIAVAWLAGNIPSPGKRSVAIGISGCANLAGIIGSELFQAHYGPGYLYPLRVTTGLMSVGWAGFAAVSITLRLVNRWRAQKLRDMTAAEIEEENRNEVRLGDKKWTFAYGL
ncbi:major facilitator superfamily transporter [Niveomyces insectorum RCEF 264]|uniref:Major facilitator superfamily transporter n=1 Tax=Niveomyces insectorum RCEF 264 TaxID=1081102 RepID=A0A167X0T9_9HYPO|nr:major facilitator superfamily transporter [Niveomyces insectorum RCEF 264]